MTTPSDYMPGLLQKLQASEGEAAVRLLAQAAETHPQDARPLLLLAAEFAQRREFDRAEAAYAAAVAIAPGFAIARFQLGLLQYTQGRPAVAAVSWAPLEALPEGDPLRLFKLAFDRLTEEDFDGAERLFAQGMAANTVNPPLNRDMQMLVDRIAAARAARDAGTAPVDPQQAHFLLSAYKSVN